MIIDSTGVTIKARGFSPQTRVVFAAAARIASARRGCKVRWYFADGRSRRFTGEIVAHPALLTGRAELAAIGGLPYRQAVETVARALVNIIDRLA